ncbi:MAG: hypothetical protein NC084_11050 [Bacteroides sp.]|nr:hypothetical protein [Eubacterium sp.]MCM1419144.1 hypothetical protein [Roseburia sp.]MCM1463231.1 hypothetical protein [Bacteroides sp.]
MQKLVYLSNSRDYTEQGSINENKYFTHINGLLNDGWRVAHITHDIVELDSSDPSRKESFVAFVLLEKDDENE